MLGLRVLLVVAFLLGVQCRGTVINIEQTVRANGYPVETHRVITKDGYILELHRIPYGREGQGNKKREVVFLMNTVLSSSYQYLYLGPKYAMAYNYADAGFDVWLGNARGNVYSRHHISLDPDKNSKEFFDFSYEQIALYDLPAIIDYILNNTKQDKLHYIGHVEGATSFLVLNAMTNTHHSKFDQVHLLAPVSYQRHFPNVIFKAACLGIDVLYAGLKLAGQYELTVNVINKVLLETFTMIPIPKDLLSAIATKQFAHYCQNIRDKSFSRWNYGLGNLSKYGSLVPPAYDVSKIPCNITLHYASRDNLIGIQDILDLVRDLPNARAHSLARPDFNFVDYNDSQDVKPLVTDYIIKSLRGY